MKTLEDVLVSSSAFNLLKDPDNAVVVELYCVLDHDSPIAGLPYSSGLENWSKYRFNRVLSRSCD